MAKICCNCGKTIGFMSADPLILANDKYLCDQCYGDIKGDINNLYYCNSEKELLDSKALVIKSAEFRFNGEILNLLEDKIEQTVKDCSTRLGIKHKEESKSNVILTTTDSLPGHEIKEILGLISGTHIYLVGGLIGGGLVDQEGLFSTAMERAKRNLMDNARHLGADAVIGIRTSDFVYFSWGVKQYDISFVWYSC